MSKIKVQLVPPGFGPVWTMTSLMIGLTSLWFALQVVTLAMSRIVFGDLPHLAADMPNKWALLVSGASGVFIGAVIAARAGFRLMCWFPGLEEHFLGEKMD